MFKMKFMFVAIMLSLHANIGVSAGAQCMQEDPRRVQLGCPHSPEALNESSCTNFNSICCWNSSADDVTSPKCYYRPEKPAYNVALGRSTSMSSKWDSTTIYDSSNGVDGCKNETTSGCCFSTDHGTNTWWSVDLGAQYSIASVTLTTTKSIDDARNLKIELSNISHNPNNHPNTILCAHPPQLIPVSTTTRIPCVNVIAAQYVIIHKITSTPSSLALCEVQVETDDRFNAALGKIVKMSSTWSEPSSTINFNGYKAVDGCFGEHTYRRSCCAHTAFQRASLPWILVDLGDIYTVYSVTLVNGRIGSNTLEKLDIQLSNDTVSNVPCVPPTQIDIDLTETENIRCTDPITAKYVHVLQEVPPVIYFCEIEVEATCRYDRYGLRCSSVCHCKNHLACDVRTGVCPDGLCMAGFQGEHCDILCNSGKYGENCLMSCSSNCINDAVCDSFSGVCPDDCKDGYMPPFCDTPCPIGTYGFNCSQICSTNCFEDDTCHNIDGHCPRGCTAGYQGHLCNVKCADGTFGTKCMYTCSKNCFNTSSCGHITGECPLGCVDGYEGLTCMIQIIKVSREKESCSGLIITVGTAVGCFICGIVLTIAVVFLNKWIFITRRNSKPKKEGSEPESIQYEMFK